jgi:hypothetical protein
VTNRATVVEDTHALAEPCAACMRDSPRAARGDDRLTTAVTWSVGGVIIISGGWRARSTIHVKTACGSWRGEQRLWPAAGVLGLARIRRDARRRLPATAFTHLRALISTKKTSPPPRAILDGCQLPVQPGP